MGYLDYAGLQRFLSKLRDTFIPLSQKGATNGVASLNSTGKVPTSQLPDSIVECDSEEDFPATGSAGVVYIADDTNMIYRWDETGEEYVPISSSGGSSVLHKISFNITVSDWTAATEGYEATVHDTNINSLTEELVMYDASIADMPGNITVDKNGSTHDMIFYIDTLPTTALSGTIYSLAAESIVVDGKVDVYQGEENEDKILQVNDEGDLELVENPFTVIDGTLNVVYYREGE